MDILSSYFSKSTRTYFIAHLFYLLASALITNRMANFLGYYYQFPSDINMATVTSFILSGQILVPMILFLLVGFMVNRLIVFFIQLHFLKRKQKGYFKDIKQDLVVLGKSFQWFEENDSLYFRGKRYFDFKETIEKMERKDISIITTAELISSCFALTAVCVWIYEMSIIFQISVSLISILLLLYSVNQVQFLYILKENIMLLKKIYFQIEENEKTIIIHK